MSRVQEVKKTTLNSFIRQTDPMVFVMKVEKAPLEWHADIGSLNEAIELLNRMKVSSLLSRVGHIAYFLCFKFYCS